MLGLVTWQASVAAVKNYRVGQGISHSRDNDLAGLRLVEDRLADFPCPDRMAPVIRGFFINADGVPGQNAVQRWQATQFREFTLILSPSIR